MNQSRMLDFSFLFVRIALGMVMLYHGDQKFLNVLGEGKGWEATIAGWSDSRGFPMWLSWLAIISEFFGGLGLITGLFTRLAAFGVACTMGVAAYGHLTGGDGWGKVEFPFMLMLSAIAIILAGAGKISLDYLIFGRRGAKGKGEKK
jgi:putative oxidoreductase